MRRLVADPAYIPHKIFHRDLIAIHSIKNKLKLKRLIHIDLSVLNLSKHLMYDFSYNNIKARYGYNASSLYTDTDNLLLQVEAEDAYEDIHEHKEDYDFSEYPDNTPYYNKENMRVVSKFKDDCKCKPVEFVGLRPKMYSVFVPNDKKIIKAKGVQNVLVKKVFVMKCITRVSTSTSNLGTNSHGLQMGVYEQNKITLGPLDTKK